MLEASLKLATVLVRDVKSLHVKPQQLRILLQFCREHLESFDLHTVTFGLLKVYIETASCVCVASLPMNDLTALQAIIGRRLMAPEVYDMMRRLTELLVRSHSHTIREACAQILLSFLLYYPLSRHRLQQQLNLLLSNLNYPYQSGRESVLEMLNSIGNSFTFGLVLFVYLCVACKGI